jgi:hypothetical protein
MASNAIGTQFSNIVSRLIRKAPAKRKNPSTTRRKMRENCTVWSQFRTWRCTTSPQGLKCARRMTTAEAASAMIMKRAAGRKAQVVMVEDAEQGPQE